MIKNIGGTKMSNADTVIKGNVTADPELNFTDNGVARVNFSLASEYGWKKDDNSETKTSFFDVVAWRKTAENAAGILEKGLPVIVTGRLEQQTWQDKETGKNRSKVVLVADSVAVNCFGIDGIQRRQRGGDYSGQSRQPAMAGGAPAKDPFDDF